MKEKKVLQKWASDIINAVPAEKLEEGGSEDILALQEELDFNKLLELSKRYCVEVPYVKRHKKSEWAFSLLSHVGMFLWGWVSAGLVASLIESCSTIQVGVQGIVFMILLVLAFGSIAGQGAVTCCSIEDYLNGIRRPGWSSAFSGAISLMVGLGIYLTHNILG